MKYFKHKKRLSWLGVYLLIKRFCFWMLSTAGRTLKFSPDCSGYAVELAERHLSGKRDQNLLRAKLFRFKNKYSYTIYRLTTLILFLVGCQFFAYNPVNAQTVVCPTETDLGTYDCTNIYELPEQVNSINEATDAPYNIQITDALPETRVTTEDSNVIFYCETDAREVIRLVIIYNDVNFNFAYDEGEEIEICTFTISTIADDTPPSFTAPDDITISCMGDLSPNPSEGIIVDDGVCQMLNTGDYLFFADAISEGSCMGEIFVTRSWTAVDPCGNAAEPQTQMITVIDDTFPDFTVPPDITLSCGSDPFDDTLTGEVFDAQDFCSDASISSSIVDSLQNTPCFGSTTYVKRWIALDDCGNSTTADQTIIVECAENCFTEVCDCDNNIFTAFAAAEPGTFETEGYTQLYLLADEFGNVLAINTSGQFPGLSSNTQYFIYAANVKDEDVAAFQELPVPIQDIIDSVADYADYCYEINPNAASYNCVCSTFVCPGIGSMSIQFPPICEGEFFDILALDILNTELANNGETDFDVLFGYYNETVSNPNPYVTAPDALFNGGIAISPNNGTTQLGTLLPPGTYTIVAYLSPSPADATCQPSVSEEITINPNPVVNLGENITACEGESIVLDAGNESSMTIWSPTGEITSAITVNTSGTYIVNIEDANGCMASDEITVTFITAFEVDNLVSICLGDTYTLPDGIIVSTSGNYPVTLISTQGCDSIITTILSVDEILTADNSVSICEEENYTLPDGTMVSTAGTYPVTLTSTQGCDSIVTTILSIDEVFTSDNPVNICEGENYTLPDGIIVSTAGTYPVTLTSIQGCDSVVNTILTVSPPVEVSEAVSICKGDSYTLIDGTQVSTAGTYPVTVTVAEGCDSIFITTLSIVDVLMEDNPVSICEGEDYTLSDGTVVSTAGIYPLTLTSTQGCDSVVNTILSIIPSIELDETVTICAGESYVLADGSLASSSGTYQVNIPTIEGCDSIINTVLTIDESCATEVCDCEYGIFTAYATAEPSSYETIDYTNVYLLTDDSGAIVASNYTGLFPNLTANTLYSIYAANVKDEDLAAFEMDLSAIADVVNQTGNYATYCYEVNANTASYTCACEGFICPVIGQIETSTIVCVGNIVDITVSGISNTLQSENGETNFDILIGAYNGSVTNPNPYTTAPQILLNEGNALTPDNGTVTLNSVGPLNNSGIFTVVAYLSSSPTGGTSCQPFAVIEVMINEAPNEPEPDNPFIECEEEPIIFSAPSGYDYLWATDAVTQDFTVFNNTSLPVTIINDNGCAQTLIYEAVFNDAPNEPQPLASNICSGLDAILVAPANYTYLWQNGSTENLLLIDDSGTYTLTITNENGCSQDLIYEINLDGLNEPQPLAISICGNELTTLTGPIGYDYLWSDGSITQSIEILNPGSYLLTITSGDCEQDLIYTVNSGGDLNESNPLPTEICEGENTTLTAPPGYNYLWYDGSTGSTINVLSAGAYTLEISDNSGCNQTLNYVVNAANATNQPQPEPITACEGDVVNLQAPVGFSYIWDDGTQASNLNVTESGSYKVIINNGCEQVLTYEVTFLPLPTIAFQTVDPTACGANNGIIQLSFTGIENGTYDLRYKGGEFNNVQVNNGSATITSLSTGIYNFITIVDKNGCEAVTDGLVEINESGEILPPPSLNSASTFCESDNVESIMAVGEPFANFTWYSDITLSTVLNLGAYYLTNGVDETVYVTQKLLGSCESQALEVNIIFNPAESLAAQSYEFCADEISSDLATVDLTVYESEIGNPGGIWLDENGHIIDAANYQFSNVIDLSYQINNENGCEATAIVKLKVNSVTPRNININRCTFENGNLINLVAFAVISGLPDTGEWSTNGTVIDSVETYILIEPMQFFNYDYIDENGCPNQLTLNITLEQAPVISAKAICRGVENFDQYFIEVTSVKNVTFNDVIVTDGNTTETVSGNGTITFGPYTHSGTGLTTTTIQAYFDGTFGCSMTLEVLETYCPEPEPCNCTNAPSAGTILGQAEPGSFNFIDFQQSYVLTDDAGTILQNNHTGLFTDLENGNYHVYAINVDEVDATVFVPALSTVNNINSFIPDKSYDGFCYTIQGPAEYEVACECFPFVCPKIGNINTTDAVCEGGTFDVSVSGISNIAAPENNETDFGILIGYYNGIVALPDPYNNPPDGLFNGGNEVYPQNGVVELTGLGANLLAGRYTIVAYLSDTPGETDCRPMVRLFTEVYDTPELYPAANPICEGTTGILTSGVTGGTFPYTIQWTDPAGINYAVQNFTIHLATQENAGNYQISVTDVKGCTTSENLEVTIVEDGTAPYVPVEVCEEIPGGAVEATVNLNEIEALMNAPGGTWRDRSGNFVDNPESVFLAGTNQFRFDYFLETQGNCEHEQVMIININSIEITDEIRSSVCRDRALTFDLIAFENEVGLSSGTWLDANAIPVENTTVVNLMEGLQFIYSVEDENGCAVPTDVSFNILEDVDLEPIQSLVCSESALAFDLLAFENEVDLSNGIWLDEQGNLIENLSSVNLADAGLQLIYSVQDEAGCYFNTTVLFSIKEDVTLTPIESLVCSESALSFDLTIFENEVDLSNGVWLDEQGNLIENLSNINLVDAGLQLIYSVQDENGCYANTPIVYTIKEDVNLEDIQTQLCNSRAISFDLTVFENEVNLSNGVWLNENGNPIENLTNINLIEAGLQLIYSIQDEDGCYANTTIIFSIKDDVNVDNIQAAVCNVKALAFDLTVFENEVNLANGFWLNQSGNLIENLTSVNLIEAGLQLTYAVQNEDGCYANTSVLFTIQEDINNETIEASVCNEAALSINLTSYENQIGGIWLDENGIPVDDATNVNLTEEGLQFIYSVQSDEGCYENTGILFTLKDDIQINTVARCVGESNDEGFVIDVTEITGGYGGNTYQLQVGEISFMYEGGTATFGPYQFNDGAIEIMAASDDDASCKQMLSIAPLYCGESPVYCDCTNLTNPVTVQVKAEPGSYNTNGYSNVYLLTIGNGTVIDFNTTGQFSGLLRNTNYNVYASNVEDIDYLIYESMLSGALIDDVIQHNGEFANICYEVNAGVAQFNENCICVDCEADAGVATLLEGGLDVVCQGDSIGPFIATDAVRANNFSYGWLVTSGAPDYMIDTLVEGRGASYASDFDLESEPGSYCVHGVSIFGDFDLFDKFIFDQSITTGAALLLAIESGQTCADLMLDACIPIEVNANPVADLESSVNLCTTEDSLYPTSIDLNDLIITATEGSTGSWYANFEDSIPIPSTIVSALDKPLGASTYFFVAGDGGCESIRYVTKVNVLDCTERVCTYTLLSSEAVCNTDGTFNLVIDVVIEDPLSNEFFVVFNETEYGPYTDTDSIGIEQISIEGLSGEAGETEIIIKDRDSNLTFEPTPVFISEIHYQNFGPTEGEGIEITALAGTDLGNYSIILYNGNGGGAYNSLSLGSIIADEGNGYGTYVLNFPLQNGPDAIALVDDTNPAYPVILQLLSYEGSFFVSDGLAMGMQTDDIGVIEPGEVGESLQLSDVGWIGPITNTMGSINNNLTLQLEPEQINCTFNYAFEIPSCGACELNPTLLPVDCDLEASTYYLEIVMEASNPVSSQYTIDLAFSGFPVFNYGNFDYGGANAVIGPFQADEVTSYEFLIQDVDSEDCNTTVFFGPYNCLVEPLVLARDAGELPTQSQMICGNDEIEIKAIGAKVTQGTELCYLLHDGSNTTIGNSIAFNNTGKFVNNGSLPLNVKLCVTAVLGNITDEGTMPTEIYDTSNCTPVVFLKSLQVGSSVNCNYRNNTYTLELSFKGGLPAYNFSEPYIVKNKGSVWYGNTLSTHHIVSGKGYTVAVSDANGCTTSYRSEPVTCDKIYVSLIAFDAKIVGTGNILDWVTKYEIDNRFFTLERSYDGIEYEPIAQKKGQGNSNQVNAYKHVDEQVQNGITHYRLMQTAYDGTVNQVGYKALSREAKLIEMDYLLPNPTTGQLYSGIMIQSKGKLLLEIVDITGRVVEQAELQVDKGLLELEFDVSAYTSGVYFIKVHYGDYSIHQKFIKQ